MFIFLIVSISKLTNNNLLLHKTRKYFNLILLTIFTNEMFQSVSECKMVYKNHVIQIIRFFVYIEFLK